MEILYQEVWDILSNRQSGSVVLLNDLTKAFSFYSRRNNAGRQKELFELLNFLETGFANFPVILHFIKECKTFISRNDERSISEFLRLYAEKWDGIPLKLAKNASSVIDFSNKTVIVQSHSGTILSFFEHQRRHFNNIHIIQTESRPVMEGREQAKFLVKSGFKVTFITDSAAARFFPETDLVISGADRVCMNHFINKTGTYALALLAKEFNKPFYVLSDSRKFFEDDSCINMKEKKKDPKEIWKNPPERLHIRNYYFEAIPNKLVTAIITETGLRKPSFENNA